MPDFQRLDRVTAKYSPHFGVGVIEWIAPSGSMLVTFEVDGRTFEDCLHPEELEPATVAA